MTKECLFLEQRDKLPVIVAKDLSKDQKVQLVNILIQHKKAIAWKITKELVLHFALINFIGGRC
jgi:hypothetical protein